MEHPVHIIAERSFCRVAAGRPFSFLVRGHYCRPLLNCKKCDQEEEEGRRRARGTHRSTGAIKQRWHGSLSIVQGGASTQIVGLAWVDFSL